MDLGAGRESGTVLGVKHTLKQAWARSNSMNIHFARRYLRMRMVVRMAGLLAVAGMTLAAFGMANAQDRPAFRLYGSGAAGDQIEVLDVEGNELGSTTVTNAGVWYVDVPCESDEIKQLSFNVNRDPALAEINPTGEDQAQVMLKPMPGNLASNTDLLADEDELVGDSSDLLADDDALTGDTGDLARDDAEPTPIQAPRQESGDSMPSTGSGGLVGAGSSAGMLGLTVALIVAGVMALGLYGVRRRI